MSSVFFHSPRSSAQHREHIIISTSFFFLTGISCSRHLAVIMAHSVSLAHAATNRFRPSPPLMLSITITLLFFDVIIELMAPPIAELTLVLRTYTPHRVKAF